MTIKKIILSIATLALAFQIQLAHAANPKVKVETSKGDMVIELYPDKAPKTVANFLAYVNAGTYDGTIFHRVIKDFMNQGGGFTADFKKVGTKDPIQNEADNGLKNLKYTVAMARTGEPHSATNQFFINTAHNTSLDYRGRTLRDWGYCVFGEVKQGMDVMDKIAAQKTGPGGPFPSDVPVTPVMIERMTLLAEAANNPVKPEK